MDIIWEICNWIIFGVELFALGLMAATVLIAIFDPGEIKWIDKIRNYMLMLDEEDFE